MAHPLNQGYYIDKATGPAYRDPHVEIKSDDHEDKETRDNLLKVLQGKDPAQRRVDMIERMYKDFQVHADRDNVMTVDEFERFKPLYSTEVRERILNNEATNEEIDEISNLSKELYDSYNPQKPTHIVDHRGVEVCPPLPPIMTRLSFLKGDMSSILDTFHTVHVNDDGQAGGMNAARKALATKKLLQTLVVGQDAEDIHEQTKQFKEQADQFNTFLHKGDIPEGDPRLATVTPKEKLTPYTPQDDVEYGPIDED